MIKVEILNWRSLLTTLLICLPTGIFINWWFAPQLPLEIDLYDRGYYVGFGVAVILFVVLNVCEKLIFKDGA